ncbi:MAG: CvpA family protein [Oscillospiraceae bacterium]|nr:CvpA family protein [Oscillospiraceae bacterium]
MSVFLILDLIAAVVLLAFIISGARRGLILSLCGLVAVLLALFGAGMASKTFSPALTAQLEPRIASWMENSLRERTEAVTPTFPAGTEDTTAASDTTNSLTEILAALKDMGFYAPLVESMEDSIAAGVESATTSASAALAATIAPALSYLIVFIAAFLILLALLHLLFRALNLVAKLPVLNLLNHTGGAVFGLVKGCIFLFLIGWLLQYFGGLLPDDAIESTVLLRFFTEHTPLSLLTLWQYNK